MNNAVRIKSTGGVAPFGYRWENGELVIDEAEAPIRRLIFELFLKHRRKKSVARLLNDLGHRTRSGALFSDATVGRLLRDTTAKGARDVDGRLIEIQPVVSVEIWEQANKILGDPSPKKQTQRLFSGIVYCGCGGQMFVPSNSPKYVCEVCRYKILADDLETVFQSSLNDILRSENDALAVYWPKLTPKDKRTIIEQICSRIVVARDTIHIEFGYSPHSFKAVVDEQQNTCSLETENVPDKSASPLLLNERLLSEAEAARFIGVSKMTLLRKRNAGEISFFKVGWRILYSKEKHLIPFLTHREKRQSSY